MLVQVFEITPPRVNKSSKLTFPNIWKCRIYFSWSIQGKKKLVADTASLVYLFCCQQELRGTCWVPDRGWGSWVSFPWWLWSKASVKLNFPLIILDICILENSFWSLLSAPSSSLMTLCPSSPPFGAVCGCGIHLCTELEKSCILSMLASTPHMESPGWWSALGLSGGDSGWAQPARWGLSSRGQARRGLGSRGWCVNETLTGELATHFSSGKCDSDVWRVNGISLVLKTCELDVWT